MAKPTPYRERKLYVFGNCGKDAIAGSFIAEAACVKDWFKLEELWEFGLSKVRSGVQDEAKNLRRVNDDDCGVREECRRYRFESGPALRAPDLRSTLDV